MGLGTWCGPRTCPQQIPMATNECLFLGGMRNVCLSQAIHQGQTQEMIPPKAILVSQWVYLIRVTYRFTGASFRAEVSCWHMRADPLSACSQVHHEPPLPWQLSSAYITWRKGLITSKLPETCNLRQIPESYGPPRYKCFNSEEIAMEEWYYRRTI